MTAGDFLLADSTAAERPDAGSLRGALYVWSIVLTAGALLAAGASAALAAGTGTLLVAAAVVLAIPPAVQLAATFVYLVMDATVRPAKPLPALDDAHLAAELADTCLVYPVIVHDAHDIEVLVATMRDCRRDCGDGFRAHVALVDFPDARTPRPPGDAGLRAQLEAALDACRTEPGPPLLALFRVRRWNPAEQLWMGWERKRGKLLEFTDLLTSAAPTSFATGRARDRDTVELLRGTRFMITLDVGSRLVDGGARRLVAAIAHPANRPVLDPRTRTVVAGHGVIRPCHAPPRPLSWFEWAWQPYVSSGEHGSFGQQMFGQDLFFGQGIVDVSAFRAALAGRIPENSVLSHDKLEGMHARAGCTDRAVVVDGNIEDYLVFRQRSHRWIRGDFHLLPWIVTTGRSGRRSLPLLGRWVLLSDLLVHLWPAAAVALLGLGWLAAPPGHAGAWTAVVLVLLMHMVFVMPVTVVLARPPRGLRLTWRTLAAELRGRLRRAWYLARVELVRTPIWIVLLADRALVAADAAARAVYRTLVSGRHVLQWTTTARARRAVGTGASARWRQMRASCAVVVALAVAVAAVNPAAIPWAAPLLLLWLLAPQVAYWLARPARQLPFTAD